LCSLLQNYRRLRSFGARLKTAMHRLVGFVLNTC
jgi:hypothetical protein